MCALRDFENYLDISPWLSVFTHASYLIREEGLTSKVLTPTGRFYLLHVVCFDIMLSATEIKPD